MRLHCRNMNKLSRRSQHYKESDGINCFRYVMLVFRNTSCLMFSANRRVLLFHHTRHWYGCTVCSITQCHTLYKSCCPMHETYIILCDSLFVAVHGGAVYFSVHFTMLQFTSAAKYTINAAYSKSMNGKAR